MAKFAGEKHTLRYQLPSYETIFRNKKTKTVKIRTYGNRALVEQQRPIEDGELPVLVFAGYGNGRRVQKLTAQTLAEDGIYAQTVHFPSLRRRYSKDLEQITIDMVHTAAAHVRGEASDTLTTFAHSKGAGIFLMAALAPQFAENNPFGDVLLLQPPQPPIIHTPRTDLTTLRERFADKRALWKAEGKYLRRMLKNKPPLKTYDDWKTLIDAAARMAYDGVTGRLLPQIGFAITHPSLAAIDAYAHTNEANVVVGLTHRDPISPVDEAETFFEAKKSHDGTRLQVIIGEGVHTTLHLREGRAILRKSLQYFPRVKRV